MFSLVVDRNVSSFLDIVSFVSFRRTNKEHYTDKEAWSLRAHGLCKDVTLKNARETLALGYLLSWAARFPDPQWSVEWFQRVVQWLEHKVSIKLIHSFIKHHKSHLLCTIDLFGASAKQRVIWWRLRHLNSRVYKRLHSEAYDLCDHDRPRKLCVRDSFSHRQYTLPCM